MNDRAAFGRLVDALRPWLSDLVFVGGWSHRLQRLHDLARSPAHPPLATRDADVAFANSTRLHGSIREALRAAGFDQELSGEHVPPVAQYRLRGDEGFYAEFLTSLQGSGRRRDGSPDATVERAGITAQRLRYLDLLIVHPWTVRIGTGRDGDVPLSSPADILIANPVCFIAQKLLIRRQRTAAKQAQDVLYVHDTLELFGRDLPALAETWRQDVRPELPAKTAREVEEEARAQFATLTASIQGAARIPRDRELDPERVRRLCEYGLRQVFAA